jgi:hyperosmotically inducible protein
MTRSKLIAGLVLAMSTAAFTAHATAQQEGAMAATSKATSDAAITTKIKSSLQDQKTIAVTTVDGVVVLSGQVASTDDGAKAIQVASAVPGVKEVKSELVVASK